MHGVRCAGLVVRGRLKELIARLAHAYQVHRYIPTPMTCSEAGLATNWLGSYGGGSEGGNV